MKVIKDVRQNEVEQGPKLGKVVLQRRTSEQQPVARSK